MNRIVAAGLLATVFTSVACADEPVPPRVLTVCADPGNMPLSNQKGEGFENKIAEALG